MEINNTVWETIATQLHSIRTLVAKLEAEETALFSQLKEISGNKSYAYGNFVLKATTRKGTIAYDAIPELKTLDLEQYRKPPSTAWQFIVLNEE